MKHRAFTEIVASTTRVPEQTVAMFARNLKSAGLLTSGARGVNAPEMTVLDLTRMLIALCATDRPSDAVESVNRFRFAQTVLPARISIDGTIVEVKDGTEFEDFLSAMLSLPFPALKDVGLEIRIFERQRRAEAEIRATTLYFHALEEFGDDAQDYHERQRGIQNSRGLISDDLINMALPFQLEKEDGATWEEMVDSGNAASIAARHIFGKPKGKT